MTIQQVVLSFGLCSVCPCTLVGICALPCPLVRPEQGAFFMAALLEYNGRMQVFMTMASSSAPDDEEHVFGPLPPPYELTQELADFEHKMHTNTWSAEASTWLDENVPLFDSGAYHFDANAWYPLACWLANQGIRNDIWHMCCMDIMFDCLDALPIVVKSSDPYLVRDLVTNWFHTRIGKNVHPKWDGLSSTLHQVPHPGNTKKEHVLSVIAAFSTPDLLAQVEHGIALQHHLGLAPYEFQRNDQSDTWRFTSWVLSPAVLGPSKSLDTFDVSHLDLNGPT